LTGDAVNWSHIVFCTMDTETRRHEAQEAVKVLGAEGATFLPYPVESLAEQKEFSRTIRELIRKNRPDIIFVPFFLDNHTDHRALNLALADAYRQKKFDAMIYAYPVWLPLYPTVLMDVSAVWERKEQAIRCYRSQLATRDYVSMSASLAQYWAGVKGREIGKAESYFRATAAEYVSLLRKGLR
jgi:LmbE family N-acetylglucosaminyl deacetylase